MQRIQFSKFGAPEVLELTEVAKLKPQSDEILVEIKAAGINPIDLKIRAGTSFACQAIQARFPSGLGFDFAGKVVAYGSRITDIAVGDEIFGSINRHDQPGTYSQYCLIKANEWTLKPHQLSFAEAAALPIPALTAYQALFNLGRISAAETVLMLGASGRVGELALQMAARAGAVVIAAGRGNDIERLNALGASYAFDLRAEGLAGMKTNVDVIVDAIGGEIGLLSLDWLKPEGKIITIPSASREQIIRAAEQKGLQADGLLVKFDSEMLSHIASKVASQKIKFGPLKFYALEEAAKAHAEIEAGTVKEKAILLIR